MPVNADFRLETARGFWLGQWFVGWPAFLTEPQRVVVELPAEMVAKSAGEWVGERAPGFDLPTTEGGEVALAELLGEEVVVSFVSTWSPQAQEQIGILDRLYGEGRVKGIMVFSGESVAKVKVFKARGRYRSSFVVDADSTLVEGYGLTGLPTHYFLDAEGKVKEMVSGVMSEEEMVQVIRNR
jgi:peroxiredoxin